MYARCLFPILLLILIAGRNLILSDDRVYPTSRRLTKFEQLNRRTRDIHLWPKDTRRKMTKRYYPLEPLERGGEEVDKDIREFFKGW
ncbi:hypothetical protein V1264_019812 [Littorina saxatilis]|uniref:Uncharacterized protein n=1 Tax=Littorina saxatilis TaxID=31220 RepID=A0AAN9B9T3_9CAEN